MEKKFISTSNVPKTRINTNIFGGGGLRSPRDLKNLYASQSSANISESIKKRKQSGITQFTILFVLFALLLGITASFTYSAFQSEATSSGTLDFYLPIYDITLDNADATTNGTSIIYEKYVIGVFKNNSCTTEITTSQNNIIIPD